MSRFGKPGENLDYWQVDLSDGGYFCIHETEARQLRLQLIGDIVEWVDFTDLTNCLVCYRAKNIIGIFRSTSESREWGREWAVLRKAEDTFE